LSLSSRDGRDLGKSHVLADVSELSHLVCEALGCVDAFSERQRVGVVVEEGLVLSCNALVDGVDTWVLLVQPRALHVGLLLWVERLRVNFADEVRNFLNALLLFWANVTACQVSSLHAIGICCLLGTLGNLLTVVVCVFSREVASCVVALMTVDNSAEPGLSALNWSVNE